jgi:hypothetical protein
MCRSLQAISHPVCLSHALNCQWSSSDRERNNVKWQNSEATVHSVFHFGGPHRAQEFLFRDGENLLRGNHECAQPSALF